MAKTTHIRNGGTEKRCPKCRKWLPATTEAYNRLWCGTLGLQVRCRLCQRKATKEYDRTPKGRAAWRRRHKARWTDMLAYHRRWTKRPDVKKRRAAKAYIYNRTEKRRAYQAAWQRAKRARLRAKRQM